VIADFRERVREIDPSFLCFDRLETLQVNLGNMCNQCCQHCHIEAGPAGDRIMPGEVMEKVVGFLRRRPGITLDITGGCPELHPGFKAFVEMARPLTPRLMVRTNLTVLREAGRDWIPPWYRDHQVVLIASMPCYTRENVDGQRGDGVYEKSVEALQVLNGLGYGESLELNLVYNPGGEFLPGAQKELERDYKRELFQSYGIRFHSLFTITNAPLGRFRHYLEANNGLEQYTRLLADSFNPEATRNIMCRTLISVGWQGVLYNCDFNLAAGMPVRGAGGEALEIDDIGEAVRGGKEIAVAEHCYTCTAGAGSSCTGVLV